MMKKYFFLLVLLLVVIGSKAQAPAIVFAEGSIYTGPSTSPTITDIGILSDGSGNLYTAGAVDQHLDLDFGLDTVRNTGNGSSYLLSYDSCGRFRWLIGFGSLPGSGGTDQIKAMTLDDSANIYVTGIMQGEYDFDPNPAVVYSFPGLFTSAYVAKYDSLGNFKWAYLINPAYFGSAQNVYPTALAYDGQGVVITGRFSGTVDFDPGPGVDSYNGGTNGNVFVMKVSSSAQYLWNYAFGGSLVDDGLQVVTGPSGQTYIAGFFRATNVDFDPSASTSLLSVTGGSNPDAFITKINSWLAPSSPAFFQWAFNLGGSGTEVNIKIERDDHKLYTVLQYFSLSFDMNPSTATNMAGNHGDDDLALIAYDLDYIPSQPQFFSWGFNIGGGHGEDINAMTVDRLGNITISGVAEDGSVDFDPSAGVALQTVDNYYEPFLASYDSMGVYRWARIMPSMAFQIVWGLKASYGGLYTGIIGFDSFGAYIDIDLTGGSYHLNRLLSLVKYGNCTSAMVPQLSPNVNVCEGQPVTLTATGGLNDSPYWNWNMNACDSLVLQGSSVTFYPSDTVTLCVKGSGFCTSNDSTASIIVNVIPLPLVDFLGLPTSICANASPLVLVPVPAGGIFSGSAGISGSTFIPADAALAANNVMYSYTDASGCSNAVTKPIFIKTPPVATILVDTDTTCVNMSPIHVKGGPSGGVLTGLTPDGEFDPAYTGTGTFPLTYIYTSPSTGCSDTSSMIITVLNQPVVTCTSPIDTLCSTDSPVPLNVSPAGGYFSSPYVYPGNVFNPSASGVGSFTFNYIYLPPYGCVGVAGITLVVDNCLSTENPSPGIFINVYPNPVTNLLNIEMQSSGTYQVMLVNTLGETVHTQNFNGTKTQLNTAELSPGVYLYRVSGNGVNATGTLIKE